MKDLIKYKNYLIKWIKSEVEKAKAKGVVIGLSGGVDSSVVASLAKEAFPENSIGVLMPIGKKNQDYSDAMSVVEKTKIKAKVIDLTKTFKKIKKVINPQQKMAMANIKPRLRMTTLYAIAQEHNYLVLGTDNAAEWLLGYFTKHGDGGVDLLPIIDLTKGEVNELAKLVELPENVYTKAPSAGLWENQTDEKELGFSYNEVDKFLKGEKISSSTQKKIISLNKSSSHKRIGAPKPMSKKEYLKEK